MAAEYQQFIAWIVNITTLSHSILHVHVGLLIYFSVRMIGGGERHPWLPVLVVVVAELFNESMDRIFYGSWRWMDTTGDIVNTILWPSVIVLVERYGIRAMISNRLLIGSHSDESAGRHPAENTT